MGAQQELWSLVEECSHGRTAAQQEEAQRIITGLSLPLALQSFYSAPQWPGPGSQRGSPQRLASRPQSWAEKRGK